MTVYEAMGGVGAGGTWLGERLRTALTTKATINGSNSQARLYYLFPGAWTTFIGHGTPPVVVADAFQRRTEFAITHPPSGGESIVLTSQYPAASGGTLTFYASGGTPYAGYTIYNPALNAIGGGRFDGAGNTIFHETAIASGGWYIQDHSTGVRSNVAQAVVYDAVQYEMSNGYRRISGNPGYYRRNSHLLYR